MWLGKATLAALLCGAVAIAAPLSELLSRQAPNTGYPSNPASQTASLNFTLFAVPIPRAEASKLAQGFPLLRPQGLPEGFLKEDEHVAVFIAGLFHDIRQLTLKIPNLSFGQILIPFVDVTRDSKSPFFVASATYQSEPVPALVGTLTQGTVITNANFDPPKAAWKEIAGGLRGLDIDVGINNDGFLGIPLPNAPVYQSVWRREQEYGIGADFFRGVVRQPFKRTIFPTCGFIDYKFDEPFADPHPVRGNLQVARPSLSSPREFKDVSGFSQTVEWDTPAGPGVPCESLRSRAQSIKYT